MPVTVLSIAIALLVGWIGIKGKGKLGNFSILIGMVAGWAAYMILFSEPSGGASIQGTGFELKLFPWGAPNLEIGIIIAALLAGLINMTNTTVALNAADKLYGKVISVIEGEIERMMTR